MNNKLASSCLDRCLGFSKRDCRQCRRKQRPGSNTCVIHRNYYKNWFATHKGFFDRNQLTSRQLNEYLVQLGGRHVVPPESLIRNLPQDMADYWELLVTCTDYPIHLNIVCLRYTLYTILADLIRATRLDVYAENAAERIGTFCKDPESCTLVFGMLIQELILLFMFWESQMPLSRATLQRLLHICLLRPHQWIQVLYSHSFHDVYQSRRDNLLQSELIRSSRVVERFFDPVVPSFINTMWTKHAYTAQKKSAYFKEELIANVYSPRRLEALLEAGGFDGIEW